MRTRRSIAGVRRSPTSDNGAGSRWRKRSRPRSPARKVTSSRRRASCDRCTPSSGIRGTRTTRSRSRTSWPTCSATWAGSRKPISSPARWRATRRPTTRRCRSHGDRCGRGRGPPGAIRRARCRWRRKPRRSPTPPTSSCCRQRHIAGSREALQGAGRLDDAVASLGTAIERYEAKRASVPAAAARERLRALRPEG